MRQHRLTKSARPVAQYDIHAKSRPAPSAWAEQCLLFALFFAGLMLLHAPLLRLPYFWDEAGYYIPAARDLFLTGALIPKSNSVECPSAAGNGMAGAGLAYFRILHASHAHSHVGAVRILVAGIISTLENRRQFAGSMGDDNISSAVSGVFHPEFPGANRPARRRIHLLGAGRLHRPL